MGAGSGLANRKPWCPNCGKDMLVLTALRGIHYTAVLEDGDVDDDDAYDPDVHPFDIPISWKCPSCDYEVTTDEFVVNAYDAVLRVTCSLAMMKRVTGFPGLSDRQRDNLLRRKAAKK